MGSSERIGRKPLLGARRVAGLATRSLVLSIGLLAGPATAAEWATALPASSVGSHLVGGDLKVMVVATGADATECDLAAASLVESLREQSAIDLVLGDAGIGDVSQLDDAAIVAKASTQPIDQVFVVRVFRSADPDWAAVVTMYDTDGTSMGGFSAATNEPLQAARAAPSAGMSSAAAAAVASVTGDTGQDHEAALQEFEDRVVWVQGWAAVSQNGAVMSTWSVPMGGRYGKALTGAKFYEWIERDELARQYKKRRAVQSAVMLGSLVPMGLSALIIGSEFAQTRATHPKCGSWVNDPTFRACVDDANTAADIRAGVVGGIIGGAGLVGFFWGGARNPHPVPENERARLVDEYNGELWDSLGLPDRTSSLPRDHPRGQGTASLWLTEGGGGATVGYVW